MVELYGDGNNDALNENNKVKVESPLERAEEAIKNKKEEYESNVVGKTTLDLSELARNSLLIGRPAGFSDERYEKITYVLNNSNVKNLVPQISEGERFNVLYNATILMEDFGGSIEPEEAIQRIMLGENSFDVYAKSYEFGGNLDICNLLKLVDKAIDDGKNPFTDEMSLSEDMIFANREIIKPGDERVLYFNRLPQDIQEILLYGIEIKYKSLLVKSIPDGDISSDFLFSDDKIFKLFVNYYNVQQRQLIDGFVPLSLDQASLSKEDKLTLQKYFKAELSLLGHNVGDVDAKILRELKERNRRIREENQKKFEEFKKRNIESNSKLNNKSVNEKDSKTERKETIKKNIDIQKASGVDIAKDAKLGEQLSEEYKDKKISEDSELIDEKAFSNARESFIGSHTDLRDYVTKETILNLYDKNSNTVKVLDDPARSELKELFKDRGDELAKLYKQISSFPKEVDNAKENLVKSSEFAKAVENKDKNNEALGSIIDNVRGMFSGEQKNNEGKNLDNGLRLEGDKPVKIDGDNLIISGKFDGVDAIVRYNLKSGEIFMNSFLQHDTDQSKITLGNNSEANQYVGKLAPFDNILSNKELLDSQVQSLIVEKSKKQSAVNSVIMKFMKTFNVIPASGEFDKLDFNKGSNLFDVIKIIEETGNPDTGNLKSLEYFNNDFMPTIMKYSGLEWGKRNENQNKNTDESQGLLSYEGDDKMINSLKNEVSNFIPRQFEGIANFDGSNQLGFVNFIKDNIIEGEGPNSQLSLTKMENFENTLKSTNYDDELLTRALSNA